jgi:serine/threonine protein kinase
MGLFQKAFSIQKHNVARYSMQYKQLVLPSGVVVRGDTGERYLIEDLLGKGEMGAVYLVKDQRFDEKLFALKEVINPDKHDRERFIFEANVLRRLDHSALPRVYRIFEKKKLKRAYILMDYIKGRNLEELRREQPEGCFPLSLVVPLMSPIVDALNYLHSQHPPIVHRDIKPANVIIPLGADEAMLVDFGSAKEYMPNGTATVATRRSPGYAAPEQYGSGTSPRTDIYGLGATFYTLLTGIVPPDALSRFTRTWGNGSDPLKPARVHNPAIPAEVSSALQRAMSITSADRFETVEEFWQILVTHAEAQSQPVPLLRIPRTETPLPRDIEPIPRRTLQTRLKTSLSKRREKVILALIVLLIIITLVLALAFHIVFGG